ncbi:hypothetical protein MKX01_019151 [Papaver californicum]|nr:hypothetical protein MKX01_019151 [Papaver californicum]
MELCDFCGSSFYYIQQSSCSTPTHVYLLKFCCLDRKGLLHDVTHVLFDLELTIPRVKVMTTPDDKVMDLFFITDTLELSHTKKIGDETCERLNAVLGDSCISCELQLAGPEYEALQNEAYALSAAESQELFSCELSEKETHTHALSPDLTKLKQATVKIYNSFSPVHTLFQIRCVDQKGLLYDIMKTSKDCDVHISYGRYSSSVKGYHDIELFTVHKDGGKINDPEKQNALCSRLKMEILHPQWRSLVNTREPKY